MLVMRHTKYKKFYAQKEMNDDQPRVYRNTSRCLNKAIGITNCRYSGLRYTHRVFYLIQNHAPQVLQEHVHIQLSHTQFEQFVEVCQTQNKVPTRLKQAAQLLDKENF